MLRSHLIELRVFHIGHYDGSCCSKLLCTRPRYRLFLLGYDKFNYFMPMYIKTGCSTPTRNSTYTSCQMSSEGIVNAHDTFMKSLAIELFEEDKRLPYLYWTSKLNKSPVKHRFIAGSSKCTTKQLSSLVTKKLTVIKTGPEKYCSIKTSHTGVNNLWILKNSTNLLSSLGHLGVHRATSIQTFDFSTLYTSIPHDLLKSRMNNIINNAFKHKNGATRYTHIKVGRNKSYFTSDP